MCEESPSLDDRERCSQSSGSQSGLLGLFAWNIAYTLGTIVNPLFLVTLGPHKSFVVNGSEGVWRINGNLDTRVYDQTEPIYVLHGSRVMNRSCVPYCYFILFCFFAAFSDVGKLIDWFMIQWDITIVASLVSSCRQDLAGREVKRD